MNWIMGGAIAGGLVGFALRRGNLCFHSTVRGLYTGSYQLAIAWAIAVSVGIVGLTIVFEAGPWDGLNRGLAFRPFSNVIGGLVFGVGMVVAASCVSGLFYKLGSGMVGALAGLGGWAAGELAAGYVTIPGPIVAGHGDQATIPGMLGVSRWAIALPAAAALAAVVALYVIRHPVRSRPWTSLSSGLILGVALVAAWVLAGESGHGFGPSTVGAVAGIAAGSPPWWLVAFLGALPLGALAASLAGRGRIRVRGETGVRYVQLVAGGVLLGFGAQVAGGCNLGHGLSGLAQLNVSSVVAVAAMAAGVGLAAFVRSRIADPLVDWRPGR